MTKDEDSIQRTGNEAERLLDELGKTPQPSSKAPAPSPTGTFDRSAKSPHPNKEKTRVVTPWIIVGLLAVAFLSALSINLVAKRPGPSQAQRSTTDSSTLVTQDSDLEPKQPTPTPAPEPPPRRTIAKAQSSGFQQPVNPPMGHWGPASSYKFGRLPDNDFPNSCAFSQTDSAGQIITSRSQMDYWACRDEGGNSSEGFSVAWVDGKRTKYTFGPDGAGSVVGTNGSTYPINWRNDTKNGSKVIILSHGDGATSWIPGHVN